MADGGDYEAERQQRIARNRQAMEVRRRRRRGARNWGGARARGAPRTPTHCPPPRRASGAAAAARGQRVRRTAAHPG